MGMYISGCMCAGICVKEQSVRNQSGRYGHVVDKMKIIIHQCKVLGIK